MPWVQHLDFRVQKFDEGLCRDTKTVSKTQTINISFTRTVSHTNTINISSFTCFKGKIISRELQ